MFPGFIDEAPIERVITRNTLSFLNETSAVNIDYWDRKLADPVNAVSVLRAHLDPWLAGQAEEAGAAMIPGIKVDRLLREGAYFTGIEAAGEQMRAKVTIVAEGVNSFLATEAGIRTAPKPKHLGLGVKSVIRIGEEAVSERFNLTGREGCAYTIVGDATKGVPGGGFLYTNRDTVSIGVVVMLEELTKSGLSSSDIHDHLVTHPYLEPFLAGGELLEYGCHLVAEGGQAMQRDLVHDGLVLVGDAAGFTLNTGLTIRGMDLAAGSAISAARAVDGALAADDFSRIQLGAYVADYESTFVGKDMHTYRRAPGFLAHDPLMSTEVGPLVADIFYRAYNHDLTPRKHLGVVAKDALAASGIKIRDLVRTGIGALRSL